MSDYHIDEHQVDFQDVLGSWLIAAVVVAVLCVLILPLR